jgi:hypothetical protein
MDYLTRVFAPTDSPPPLNSIRILVAQWGAQVRTEGDEEEWDMAEVHYSDDFAPIELERYLPATDGIFEEEMAAFRSLVEGSEGPGRQRVLEALEATRQIVAFRVRPDAEDAVYEPLNAAMDAVTSVLGGISHAEGEGFYDAAELILATD